MKPVTDAPILVEDMEYQADPVLLARVYRPSQPGRYPCIVDVHGGGWGAGDRTNNVALNEALARAGIVVAALDFRLSDQARFPGSVADVNAGIRWLKSMAETFGGRADRVGGLGTSSGGHQLLLNALRPHDPLYAAEADKSFPAVDATLRFAVACWPVADPWARYRMASDANKEALLRAHAAYWATDDDMKTGNPQLILERGLQTHLPPLLALQGTSDDNLTPDMAERLVSAYRTAGGTAELAMFEREPHAFINRQPNSEASVRAISMIAEFIAAHSG